jgi:hypothetical protein
MTDEVTSHSRNLLEELTVTKLVKKFPAFKDYYFVHWPLS